jgi:hypothetical protein
VEGTGGSGRMIEEAAAAVAAVVVRIGEDHLAMERI